MTDYADYLETIKGKVKALDQKWFVSKEAQFMKEKFYDKASGSIKIVVEDGSYNYDVDEEGESYPTNEFIDTSYTIKIDLRRYCSLYLPLDGITNWGDYSSDSSSSNPNTKDFSHEILAELKLLLRDCNDVVLINKVISVTLDSVSEVIKKNIEKYVGTGDTYKNVLSDFLIHCSGLVHREFSKFETILQLSDSFEDKLEFKLQQEELVSLLYVLNKAGMINSKNEYDKEFLRFCINHFKFQKKAEFVSPKDWKTFSGKYQEILNEENGKGLEKIKERLIKILNEI